MSGDLLKSHKPFIRIDEKGSRNFQESYKDSCVAWQNMVSVLTQQNKTIFKLHLNIASGLQNLQETKIFTDCFPLNEGQSYFHHWFLTNLQLLWQWTSKHLVWYSICTVLTRFKFWGILSSIYNCACFQQSNFFPLYLTGSEQERTHFWLRRGKFPDISD